MLLILATLLSALGAEPEESPDDPQLDVIVGGGFALVGWHRSADHAALIGLTAVASVRAPSGVGATAEAVVARSREANAVTRMYSIPTRLSATVDGTLRRGGIGFSVGTGPALVLLHGRVATADNLRPYTGTTASAGWRGSLSVDGRLAGPLSWRMHGGITARRGGMDTDFGISLVGHVGEGP